LAVAAAISSSIVGGDGGGGGGAFVAGSGMTGSGARAMIGASAIRTG
jgi:hypothetical protein